MEKKMNNLVLSIICGIFTVLGIVVSIISLVNGSKDFWLLPDVVGIVLSAMVGYYAVCGYKKPHGNLLKYIILIFAASYLVSVYKVAQLGVASWCVLFAILIGILCYVAGRLHRVKQNAILMGVAVAIIVLSTIMGYITDSLAIGAVASLIVLLDICVAYFLRYKEHKEAGLMDAPKN